MKTYKNITNVEQLDIEPGQTGEREIDLDQEQRMVARGAIEVVTSGKPDTPAEPEKTPEEQTTTDKPESGSAKGQNRPGRGA